MVNIGTFNFYVRSKELFHAHFGAFRENDCQRNKAARGDSKQLVPRELRGDAADTQPPLSSCGRPSVSCQPLKGPRPGASLRAVPRAHPASQPAEKKTSGLQAEAGPVLRMWVVGTPCTVGPPGGCCPRVRAQLGRGLPGPTGSLLATPAPRWPEGRAPTCPWHWAGGRARSRAGPGTSCCPDIAGL